MTSEAVQHDASAPASAPAQPGAGMPYVESELEEARRVLAFVYHRSKFGLFSNKRSLRDAALADVNYWTEQFRRFYTPPLPPSRDCTWCGESP